MNALVCHVSGILIVDWLECNARFVFFYPILNVVGVLHAINLMCYLWYLILGYNKIIVGLSCAFLIEKARLLFFFPYG